MSYALHPPIAQQAVPCKAVVVGDSGCGKTSLVARFNDGVFSHDTEVTTAAEFVSKRVAVGGGLSGAAAAAHTDDAAPCGVVALHLWDTAGSCRYRALGRTYYRHAAACLVVYDVTRRASFESVPRWVADVRADAADGAIVLLVGNKADDEARREVAPEEGAAYAEEARLDGFFETSAKTGLAVDAVFQAAGDKYWAVRSTPSQRSSTLSAVSTASEAHGAVARRTPSGISLGSQPRYPAVGADPSVRSEWQKPSKKHRCRC